jgi:hypothetical protein
MTTVLDGAGERSPKACGPKTGQVLVRTRPHPDARKAQCFQSRKLAMSGGLNFKFTITGVRTLSDYLLVRD